MADLGRDVSAWQTAVQRFDELAAERMDLHVTNLISRAGASSSSSGTSSGSGRQETENDP
jgi:hypothetical protein